MPSLEDSLRFRPVPRRGRAAAATLVRAVALAIALSPLLAAPAARAAITADADAASRGSTSSTANEPDLLDRIARLEAQVARLRVGGRHDEATRSAARQGLQAAVLADADARAVRLDGGATAGHDERFFVASADGAFRLDVTAYLQVAYYASRRRDDGSGSIDPFRGGFELRRARWKLRGHLFDPSIGFELGTAFDRNRGAIELSDAFIRWRPSDDLRIDVGNAKPYWLWEWRQSAKRLPFADRSLVSKRFAPDRAPGVHAAWDVGDLALRGTVADPTPGAGDRDHLVSARAVRRIAGTGRALRDALGRPGDGLSAQVAGGVLDRREAGTDTRAWTIDGTVQGDGWFVGAEAVFAREASALGRQSPWAAMVHAGVFVSDRTFVALEVVHGDGDEDAADLLTTTIGFVHLVHGEDVKWHVDVGYGWHPVSAAWSSSGAGWLTDAPGEDGQVVVRTQLQLGF